MLLVFVSKLFGILGSKYGGSFTGSTVIVMLSFAVRLPSLAMNSMFAFPLQLAFAVSVTSPCSVMLTVRLVSFTMWL